MTAVVLGAGGLLGRHLVEELRRAGHAVRALDRAACDVRSAAAVDAAVPAGATWVLNCAGYTDVDGAELDEDEAYRVNALGAEHAALAARRRGALLVHVSTDFVFDGRLGRPYDELDPPSPLSVYGRSKLAGERLAAATGARVVVVRTQALFGAGGRNFASRLPQLLAAGGEVRVDAERHVQPTWARPLARQLIRIAGAGVTGLVHACSSGTATWADVAAAITEGRSGPPAWRPVPTVELGHRAPRPPASRLETRLLRLRGLDEMPAWRAGLAGFLSEVRS